jgi:hypothetical protein
MRRAAFALLFLLTVAAYAQDQAPPMVEATPTPAVVTVAGQPAALAPAPPEASVSEVKAVADQATETLKDVADGKVSIEQATRDPGSTPDPGAGYLILMVGTIAAGCVRYITDMIVKRVPEHVLPDVATSLIGHSVTALVFVGAWALLHGGFPDLPQTWQTWIGMALTGSAGGGAARSGQGWAQDRENRRASATGSFTPPLSGTKRP